MPLRNRLFALAALACLVLAGLSLGYLLISSLLVLLLAIAVLSMAILAGWMALINRGVRRVAGLSLGVLLLVAAVAVLWPKAIAGMIVVIVLAIASAASARVAIGPHRPLSPEADSAATPVGPALQPVLLVNPLSGDGVPQQSGLIAKAIRRGIMTVVVRPDDDLGEVARREIAEGATAIGVAGGDGSQAVVASIASEKNIAFVCVPAGTRNHFAQDLGLDRSDPVAALEAFGRAVERHVDLGSVNGRVFVNNASMGAYAAIVQVEEYRAAKLATATAMLPDLVGAEATPFDLRFAHPDGTLYGSADLLLVSNNPYALVTAAGVGGRPRLDSGSLGVLAIRARAATADTAKHVLPTETTPRHVVLNWASPTLRVDSAGPVAMGIDGEAVELEPPLEFTTLHRALRVRLPRNTVAPAAVGRAPGPKQTISALLRVLTGKEPWA